VTPRTRLSRRTREAAVSKDIDSHRPHDNSTNISSQALTHPSAADVIGNPTFSYSANQHILVSTAIAAQQTYGNHTIQSLLKPYEPSSGHPSKSPSALTLLNNDADETPADERDQYFAPGRYAGPSGGTAADACSQYEPGELDQSKQESGVLSSPVWLIGPDTILVADFGVNWRHVKDSAAKHPLLATWRGIIDSNPFATIEMTGFSDCVGTEGNNEHLRAGRARRVAALLGSEVDPGRYTVKAAPRNTFFTDNLNRFSRAMNRSVTIRIHFPVSRPQIGLIKEDNLCGGQKCFSDEDLKPTEEAKGKDAASDLAPSWRPLSGSKDLKKGTMKWTLQHSSSGTATARIQIEFTAKPTYRSHTVTFLQTVLSTKVDSVSAPSEQTLVDLRTDIEEVEPFYGADWDPDHNAWQAESVRTPVPAGFKNAPSSSTDPTAYLFDEPVVFSGMARIFESVVVVPETGEVLGSLRWGLTPDKLLGGRLDDCTDLPSAGFDAVMKNFYSMPKGSDPQSPGRFDVIIDGYDFGQFELSGDNQKKLDPIVNAFLNYPRMWIAVSGFADAGEHDDPDFTSLMRALLVQRYMMSKGVPQDKIDVHSFGAAWARYPTSPGENRNRRVQVRTYYK
jgi:outer membrane protein OmpA-like peptidoglycan-associated protein